MNINSLMFSDAVFTHTQKKVVFAEQKNFSGGINATCFFFKCKSFVLHLSRYTRHIHMNDVTVFLKPSGSRCRDQSFYVFIYFINLGTYLLKFVNVVAACFLLLHVNSCLNAK